MLKQKKAGKGRDSTLSEDKVKALLTEKDAKISALTSEISKLTNALNNASVATATRGSKAGVTRRQHPLTAFSTTIQQDGDSTTQVRRDRKSVV